MRLFIAAILALALALPAAAQTTSKTLVLLGDYSIGGTTIPLGCALNQVQNTMFTDPNGFSVKEAYKEASYSQYSLTGDVFGPYHVVADDISTNGVLNCGQYPTLSTRMLALAKAQGVDMKKYNRWVYVLPFEAGCDNSAGGITGETNIQGNTSWIFACDDAMTYEHEIGHTLLGGNHSIDDADPMNSQNNTLRLFNAAGTLQLGWMAPAGVADITYDGTYYIAPLELTRSQTPLTQIFRLRTSVATYALSYRQPLGVDRDLAGNLNDLRINNTDGYRNLVGAIAPGTSLNLDNVTIQNTSNSGAELVFSVRGLAAAPPPPSCTASATTLCLQNGRFSVTTTFNSGTSSGQGQAIPFSSDTGYFWFFSSNNTELAVKVLDGRPVNGSFWVFYGGLTNLQYSITVTDLWTGNTETYQNPAGSTSGGSDTTFGIPGYVPGGMPPTVTSGVGMPATTCTPSASTLCLQPGGDTIKVEVTWQNGSQSGAGQGGLLPNTNQGGYFTFFDPGNVELLVKVIDGRAVNQRYWVFTGALSNVEYSVTFTDVTSGRWVNVHNPAGNYSGAADTGSLY